MAEYVNREAAIEAADHAYNEWNLAMATADGKREINLVYKRQELCRAVASVFESAPAADVAPVRHGRWDDSGKYTFPDGSTAVRCTECGCAIPLDQFILNNWNFCPVCGAKMDGGTDEA